MTIITTTMNTLKKIQVEIVRIVCQLAAVHSGGGDGDRGDQHHQFSPVPFIHQ